MTKQMVETKYYTFNQNNSGGRFKEDDNVAGCVIIEALNAANANSRAEEIGIYFDGDGDCSCCGNRWYSVNEKDGEDEPMIYDKSPFNFFNDKNSWKPLFNKCIIYYLDGTKDVIEKAK